jgi:4-diphosphocytidyl-2-C-methyl-D-erythritol kinase
LWRDSVENDFERHIFDIYPQIREYKEMMYAGGALYASMSGSGSAVFGIFRVAR